MALRRRKIKKSRGWEVLFLILIFLAVFSIRLYFALQKGDFSDDSSYFTLRQMESMKNDHTLLFNDKMSFGGRTNVFMPMFNFIMFPFYLMHPSPISLKIALNLAASSIVIIMFFIVEKLTKNRMIALASSLLAGFIPVFFSFTVNELSSGAIVIPLMLLTILCFMNLKSETAAYGYLFTMTFLSALSPAAIILVAVFLAYLILMKIGGVEHSGKELEAIMFSTFLVVWRNFIFYKKALLFHGPGVIWQNAPSAVLSGYFSSTAPLDIIYQIGALPLVVGIYSAYRILSKEKERNFYIFVSFAVVAAVMIWFKVVEVQFGMVLLSLSMIVLFSYFLKCCFDFMSRKRAGVLKWMLVVFLIGMFTLTSIIPSTKAGFSSLERGIGEEEIGALQWLEYNSEANSTVLSSLNEGHAISFIARRKNVWDSNFLLIDDVDMIFRDVERIYKTRYETEAVGLLNKYSIDYIVVSRNVRDDYSIDDLNYAENIGCFNPIYSSEEGGIKIYKSLCRLM